MLTFKEFVFASWKLRGFPTGKQAEGLFKVWEAENPNNGWFVRYEAWKDHGCPMPVQDIDYNEMPIVVQVHDSVVVPIMTLEEFYAEKLNYVMNSKYFQPSDFNTEKEDSKEAWKESYNIWIKNGCIPFSTSLTKSIPPKKQIRYLNRV